jgi:putative endonuclease
MFFVYILRTSKNTLYIGQTNNLEKRLRQHKDKKGKGSKYMRSFESFELVYVEKHKTRSEALKREIELKKLTKNEKEKIIFCASY